VTEQEKRGYLYAGDISEIPATDLRTIDQLWVKYSSGKFGFSVQKQIWYEVNQNLLPELDGKYHMLPSLSA